MIPLRRSSASLQTAVCLQPIMPRRESVCYTGTLPSQISIYYNSAAIPNVSTFCFSSQRELDCLGFLLFCLPVTEATAKIDDGQRVGGGYYAGKKEIDTL
jgi:hypothetical protein